MAYTTYCDLPFVVRNQKLEVWVVPTSNPARDNEILLHATTAQGMIDSYLVQRFPDVLPFTSDTIPPIIKGVSLAITLYLMVTTQQATQEGLSYRAGYDWAIETLTQIREGELNVFSTATGERLNQYDSTYGFHSNAGPEWDCIEDDYNVFPRSSLGCPPSTLDRTYREEDGRCHVSQGGY